MTLVALLLAATTASAAPAPQAWTKWTEERRAELAKPLSPAALVVMARLRDGAAQVLEKKGDAWRVRLATQPARGEEKARFLLVGGTVSITGVAGGVSALPSGKELMLPSLGLGLTGYDRGGGKFTLLVFDMKKKGLKTLKRVETFPYDPAFAVSARAVHIDPPEKITFQHSDGDVREQERPGRLEFTLKGKTYSLAVHGARSDKTMFVLFKDPTNKKETYGAGRFLYLELGKPWSEVRELTLDLNHAFSPYCLYSPAYSCPLATDRLDVPVTVGERLPPGFAH